MGIWFEAQSSELVDDVLTRLLVLSGVVLVVFAVAAAGSGLVAGAPLAEADRRGHRDGQGRVHHRPAPAPGTAGARDEIKELADTIDDMLDRLESAFAAQDRFVANASHELRTPLTTSRTALGDPAEPGPGPGRPATGGADRIAGRRAFRSADHLAADAGPRVRASRRREDVDLAEIVDEVIDSLAEPVAAAGLTAASRHSGTAPFSPIRR